MEAEKTGPEPHTSTAACGNLARAAILTAGRSELAAGSASGSSPTLRQRGSSTTRRRSSRRRSCIPTGSSLSPPLNSKRRISEPYSPIAGQSGRDRLADADRDTGRDQTVFAGCWSAAARRGYAVCARGYQGGECADDRGLKPPPSALLLMLENPNMGSAWEAWSPKWAAPTAWP
jgi:hypothetical protein